MAEVLKVDVRTSRGKHFARRMRKAGSIPGVLYGHGEKTVALTVPAAALEAALRHGSRVVELAGGVSQSALILDLQWNTWGTEVIHVDFARVSADEVITVTIPIELRGEAPGVKAGGVIEHLLHEVEVVCKATAVPEKLKANVNHLELGGVIRLGDLEVPGGGKCEGDLETIVVQCVEPTAMPEEEEEAAAAGEAEPEVIGGRKEEEGEEA
ncbi:MAG: 50S ribosomal protein L25 [Pirellulales bacterium]|nr:50S ribosomal protein L25 [Pirellulales bacterium]